MRRPRAAVLSLVCCVALLSAGCTRTQSERGVQPLWRELPAGALRNGETTKSDVMGRLGPPSQVITHDNGEIFYYLHERAQTRSTVLIVYNTSETSTSYDRAIFFFDRDGVLLDYSLSAEEPAP